MIWFYKQNLSEGKNLLGESDNFLVFSGETFWQKLPKLFKNGISNTKELG